MNSAMTLSRSGAEDFLYAEARLIDEDLLEQWLQLFTADGIYWLPSDESTDPEYETSIIMMTDYSSKNASINFAINTSPRIRDLAQSISFRMCRLQPGITRTKSPSIATRLSMSYDPAIISTCKLASARHDHLQHAANIFLKINMASGGLP